MFGEVPDDVVDRSENSAAGLCVEKRLSCHREQPAQPVTESVGRDRPHSSGRGDSRCCGPHGAECCTSDVDGGVDISVGGNSPSTAVTLILAITVLSIAPLISRAIKEVFEDGSVTSLFDGAS